MPEQSWWRRNRLSLLALPVLLALVVGGNAIRLDDYWWNTDLRRASDATPGKFVDYTQDFHDALGDTSRSLQVRLDGVERVDSVPQTYGDPTPIPDGLTGYRVDLSFRADPDQSLRGCQLALLDDNGNRYEFRSVVDDLSQDASPCLVFGKEGPQVPIFEGNTRDVPPGEERPRSWETSRIVFVPDGVRVTQVALWWEQPRYLRWTLPR